MKNKYQYERGDLAQVRAGLLHLFGVVGIFSVLVNLLLLTGPLYMLHIYDRVLPSGTQQTLVALSLMALLAYTVMGVLDHARARITARIAARFLTQLDQCVFSLAMQSAESGKRKEPQAALKDLSSIENFIASPALLALFDLPWVPDIFCRHIPVSSSVGCHEPSQRASPDWPVTGKSMGQSIGLCRRDALLRGA
jgi:ATP-binding cassette subfamily C protein